MISMIRKKKIHLFSFTALMGILLFSFVMPTAASADAVAGETVVTLGQDLTPQQKEQIKQEMGVDNNARVIEVTNQEEHKYLGNYLDASTIGTRALSSAKITLADPGTGIKVKTHNITTITETMYANALITAGVKDADVYVTAPMKVSGTAGLTGIIKAFETATGQQVSEEQKQVANEEMVRTSELGEKIGDKQKAAEFMMKVKEEIAKQQPQTAEEVRDIIVNVAGDLNINLNDQDINQLTQLMNKFSQLNIDWDALTSQVNKLQGQLDKVLNSPETQNFLEQLFAWLSELWNSIKSALASQ
ncbi:hypothetical protein GCM10011571_19860 [Marinithermofilum abyssi]|uniref:DUF1002 domain-containing protein n=1 Tax=Marinithermofilum abyssi TaxID=1571185 RepID=A0A8J2Y999_9BACL|nr:DUF1002 domain-containing protein [Marinithermofilum abyssi]GGE18087.1 hypothetical protein GCM10011571_19860 [Marinithermofilum abyssi]